MYSIQLLIAISSNAAPLPAIDQEEFRKIQGDWIIYKDARHGEIREIGPAPVLIGDDRISLLNRSSNKSSLKVARLRDGEIDLVREFEPFKGDTVLGIYKFQGDELWLCYRLYGTPTLKDDPPPRPKEFASPKDSELMVYVLRRPAPKKQNENK